MISLALLSLAAAPTQSLDDPMWFLREPERAPAPAQFEVDFADDEDGGRITIVAVNASLRALVEHVALQSIPARTVVGLDSLSRDPGIDARLDDIPLEDALRWIGGSVGLRIQVGPTRIEVAEDLPPYPARQDLYKRAKDTWFQAIVRHPEALDAPRAAMYVAEIEAATQGREAVAAGLYWNIVEDYPDSDLVPDALLAAGNNFGRAGDWSRAREAYDELAGYPTPHDHAVEATRRLAEAHGRIAEGATNPSTQRDSAQKSLLVLDRLDDLWPAETAAHRRARLIIRSRAYSLADRAEEALKALDLAAAASPMGDRDPELMELRALALDRGGRHEDAFRAWMQHADRLPVEERGPIYARAAKSANAARSHIAAILTWHAARNDGLGHFVDSEYQLALVALGLEMDVRADQFGDRERIARAERAFAREQYEAAAEFLRQAYARRMHLESRDERLRLVLLYARALERSERDEEAILTLREAAQEFEPLSARKEIYLLASRIHERAGDIDRAIQALNGSL